MTASTPLQGKTKTPAKKPSTTGVGKWKGKSNGNIMSFFKRAESSGVTVADLKEEDEGLFMEDSPAKGNANMLLQTPTPPREEISMETWPGDVEMDIVDSPISRYNENAVPNKKRRTIDTPRQSPPTDPAKLAPTRGPFVDDSDSDDEQVKPPSLVTLESMDHENDFESVVRDTTPYGKRQAPEKDAVGMQVPSLKRETTGTAEVNEFEGIEDFIDDEFPEEGEEYLERRWMEEQAEFEEGLEEEGQAMEDDGVVMESRDLRDATGALQDAEASSCPICGGNTTGLNDQV